MVSTESRRVLKEVDSVSRESLECCSKLVESKDDAEQREVIDDEAF